MFRVWKRMVSLCLAAMLLLSTMPFATSAVQAEEITPAYEEYDGILYVVDEMTYEATVMGYTAVDEAVTIPEKADGYYPVTAIADGAFAGCDTMTSLTLPYTVYTVGENAFSGCDSLQAVTYTGDETSWDIMCIADGNESLTAASREYTVQNRYAQEDILYALYPDKTASALGPQWSCYGFVGIPETIWYEQYTVTAVAANAFVNDYNDIYSVYLPKTLISIGENAFAGCTTIDRVMFFGSEEEWYSLDIGAGNEVLFEAHLYFEGTEFVDYDHMYYALLPDGTAELISVDTMSDTVVIPEDLGDHTVTYIYENAFQYAPNVTTLKIPAVTYVGENAFSACGYLWYVVYGGTQEQWEAMTVESGNEPLLGAQVFFKGTEFDQNDAFFYAVLPDQTVKIIGVASWPTTSLVIPETIDGYPVTAIGRNAFRACDALEELIIEAPLTFVDKYAFEYCCNLRTVIHRSSEEEWQAAVTEEDGNAELIYARHQFGVTDIVTENDMTFLLKEDNTAYLYRYIGDDIGGKVYVPAKVDGHTVTTIGSYAFWGYGGGLVLPKTIQYIEEYAFDDSVYLSWVCYEGAHYEWYNNVMINEGNSGLSNAVFFYEAIDKVDDGQTEYLVTIYEEAKVVRCREDGDVVILDEVNGYPVTEIGEGAFEGNYGVTSVTLGRNVCQISDGAFYQCSQLTRIDNVEQLRYIGVAAFRGTALQHFTIGPSLYDIGDYAFYDCWDLHSITIESSCVFIGEYTFDSAYLKCLIFTGSQAEWENALSCDSKLGYYPCVTEVTECVTVDGVTYAVRRNNTAVLVDARYAKGDVVIPSAVQDCPVTEIIERAFEYASDIDSLTLPDTLEKIGDCAFYGCWLPAVVIPDSVTEIGYGAFMSCSQLTSAVIGTGITMLPSSLFAYCKSLETVTIPAQTVSIGHFAFEECYALSDVYYADTIDAWEQIDIWNYNDPLLTATLHTKLKRGDPDGDNTVTTSDARMALGCAIGLEPLTEEQLEAADYNGDGKVNSADARRMLLDIATVA